jgi:signal transduction histidine kinase/HAMP domain-containing protein
MAQLAVQHPSAGKVARDQTPDPAPARPPLLSGTPVATRLATVIVGFIAIVAAVLAVMVLSLKVSNGVRAYVTGEALWSRAQKEAAAALERYARTHDEQDFAAYQGALGVNLGDRIARLELEKPRYDRDVATRGFAQGGNNAGDIPDMIFLFRHFRRVHYLEEAIGTWEQGDRLIDRVGGIAAALRHEAAAPAADHARVEELVAELQAVDRELTVLELHFSSTLAEGARWIHATLLKLGVLLTAGLVIAGLLLARRIGVQLREELDALKAGTARVAAGDLGSPIPVISRDELGELAHAFNGMVEHRRVAADTLEHRLRFEALITRLSSSMTTLTAENVNDGINRALGDIGQFAQVDRSYIFLFDAGHQTVTCSHEWCAPGVAAQIGRLQNLPVADFPWVEERLQRGEIVHVPRVGDLPPEAAAERREWEAESIRSLLLIPMRAGATIRGYVGLDSVRAEKAWPPESNDVLRIFGEIILATLTRVQAESALLERNQSLAQAVGELERSNAELEQFAYVASHDLKTPLRGINGFLQLLRKRHVAKADPQASEFIQLALDSVDQMQALIGGLLELSRIGRAPVEPAVTDCEAVLREVTAQLGSVIAERRVVLTHDPLPTVQASPIEIQQLLQNLIANAIKFQPGDAPRVHASAARDGAFWRFAVRDHGIGIRPEHQQRIFQLFQRLHSQAQYEGSGIGLTICRKIVQRHGGRIWVESQEGRGSTFCFTLKA